MADTDRRRRHDGAPINGEALDAELIARGMDGADLARIARVHRDVVTRARHSEAISRESWTKIIKALEKVPVSPLAARLVGLQPPRQARAGKKSRVA